MQINFDLLQCGNQLGEYPTSSCVNAMEARAAKSHRRKEKKNTGTIVLSVLPMALGDMR